MGYHPTLTRTQQGLKTMGDHLVSTSELVRRAYPDGVPEEEYFPLLFLLSGYLSDRNLADLAEQEKLAVGRVSYLNDVYRARQESPENAMVIARLSNAGLAEWIEEAE
jgi:hypothetical protein